LSPSLLVTRWKFDARGIEQLVVYLERKPPNASKERKMACEGTPSAQVQTGCTKRVLEEVPKWQL